MAPHPSRWPVLAAVTALLAGLAPTALAEAPYPADRSGTGATDVHDYAGYLYVDDGSCDGGSNPGGPRDLPANFDCTGDWKYTDHRESFTSPPADETWDPDVAANPQEFYGVKGTGLNRAWEVSTGRPDVVIAVLDSGIRWEEDRPELLRKHFLNRGELPAPQDGTGTVRTNPDDEVFGGYDVDGDTDADGVADGAPDGIFNVADYWADGRVSDLNGNGAVDPEDLIRAFSDGVDDDGNGYVDDISGWDFLEDDNNPQDDVDYGHGTGEAEDSTGEADLADGQCPNCMVMSMRVGDSFVADVNHFAEAVVYAVDNGASVIQEALGTLNHTSFGQAAIDHAYRNGVIVNASEADEAAGHHNWPAAYDRTMVVNSIRTPSLPTTRPYSYLYFNGCTNFGGYTYVSIPSTSCSSEATGRSAGVSGLLYSAARNAIDRGFMTPYLRDDGTTAPFPLSAEEAKQLWRLSADDIDFASGCPEHPFCDDAPPDVGTPTATPNDYTTTTPDTTRYQTVAGWDYFTGYGRNNAARLVHYIGRDSGDGTGERVYAPTAPHDPYAFGDDGALTAQDRIPPEADIAWPRWWHQYGYRDDGTLLLPDDPAAPDQVVIHGRVAANRVTAAGGTFDWVLEYAPGVQGLKDPADTAFPPPAGTEERSSGPWTTIASGTGLAAAYEGELGRVAVSDLAAAITPATEPFDPATDPTSQYQPERNAIRLRVRVLAHPVDTADTVNNEAIVQKQIDVYPAEELLVRDDLGVPIDDTTGIADLDQLNVDALGRYAGGAPSPAFHDLDGDGVDEALIASSDGVVHAFTDLASGTELPGWPVTVDPYEGVTKRLVGDGTTPVTNAYTQGSVTTDVYGAVLLGTPAVADLDDDGEVEVLIGDLEGRMYAWQADGTRRPGFPVSVDRGLSEEVGCEEVRPDCDDYEAAPPKRDRWNARDWGINSAPAIGDLDGDPANGLEIVVGANDAHVYAWHADGTPVAGWPVVLRDPAKVATMDPDTRLWTYTGDAAPAIGTKILVSPSLGDIDGDGALEVVIGVNEEYVEAANVSADQPLPGALSASGLADPGNTRIYALHHDGADHEHHDGSETTPHTQDQAYVSGWPVPIALLVTNLLPYVGAGTNTQAVVYDADADGAGLEIAVASAAGPGYVLEDDGTSYLQGGIGGYRTLATTGGVAPDQPTFVGVGALAVGSLDGGIHHTLAGPGAGLARLLDIVVEGDQANAHDHLQLWNGSLPTGQYEPNAPVTVNDLQFFTPPMVGDLTGDGFAEVVQSTAVGDTVALGLGPPYGTEATALRHFTGGWTVASTGIGDGPLGSADDGNLELAGVTREGYLRLWPTDVSGSWSDAACTAVSEWPEYGHDAFNSGTYGTDAERPYPISGPDWDETDGERIEVTFTATGDDRSCGAATRYEVRRVDGQVADPSWEDGEPVAFTADDPPAAGVADVITLDETLPTGRHTLLIRAYDDACTYRGADPCSGNGSAVTAIAVANNLPPVADAGSDRVVPAEREVRFVGSGSSDPDGDPLTFAWDFGDGATAAGEVVTHTFDDPGAYTVTLTVTDPTGASDDDVALVTVTEGDSGAPPTGSTNRPPTVSAGPDRRVLVGDRVPFDGTATDPDGDALTVAWTFGDGSSAPSVDATHAYGTAGHYTASLRATDGDGASDTDAAAVQAIDLHRIAGTTRVETAVEIARRGYPSGADTVVLTRDDVYADALAGTPLAYQLDAPILLTPGGGLHAAVRDELHRLGVSRAVLLGGTAALSRDVEDDLRSMGVEDIDRIGGVNRSDTARLIAHEIGGTAAFVVEGEHADPTRGWPDAMSVAPLAARTGTPILLVTTDRVPPETSAALDELRTGAVTIVGGPAAVSDQVERAIQQRGIRTDRVAGPTRYATSAEVALRALARGAGADDLWLAQGGNWPDALAAGPVVAARDGVLLLVDPAELGRSTATRDWLALRPGALLEIHLLGGPSAISVRTEEDLGGLLRAP